MSHAHHEELILELLQQSDWLTIEQLTARLPELTWNELFQTVDALSRNGAIILRRRGFQYELHRRLAVATA
jgi:DNA-binding transcriptional ArsR family regulator